MERHPKTKLSLKKRDGANFKLQSQWDLIKHSSLFLTSTSAVSASRCAAIVVAGLFLASIQAGFVVVPLQWLTGLLAWLRKSATESQPQHYRVTDRQAGRETYSWWDRERKEGKGCFTLRVLRRGWTRGRAETTDK